MFEFTYHPEKRFKFAHKKEKGHKDSIKGLVQELEKASQGDGRKEYGGNFYGKKKAKYIRLVSS